jgi:undecaprenyl-diphosphatase
MTATQAVLGYIQARDHRLMRRVHRWRAPRWIRRWMIVATRLGDGWVWFALAVGVFLFGGSGRFVTLGAGQSAALAGILIFRLLKKASGRQRPCALEPHCWAHILPPDQFSFPSGHSITAFAVTVSVGLFHPEMLPFLLFLAVSIAASRIILGMHFLSDVLAGSLIGAGLGYVSFLVFSL